MGVNRLGPVLVQNERVSPGGKIRLKVGDGRSGGRVLQVVTQGCFATCDESRRLGSQCDGHSVGCPGRIFIGRQAREGTEQVRPAVRGHEGLLDELRSPSGGQEVGKDAVITGARQRGLNRKTSVVRLFRMNMVEVVQILAYDKEMESLVVYDIEFAHLLARDRILNLKSQANPLA